MDLKVLVNEADQRKKSIKTLVPLVLDSFWTLDRFPRHTRQKGLTVIFYIMSMTGIDLIIGLNMLMQSTTLRVPLHTYRTLQELDICAVLPTYRRKRGGISKKKISDPVTKNNHFHNFGRGPHQDASRKILSQSVHKLQRR